MKKLIVVFFLFATSFANAQDDFSTFYKVRDSLMTAAYNNKDINTFNKYFDELQARYKSLDDKEKAGYKDAISGAYYNRACTYALTGDKKKALDNLEKSEYYDYDHLLADTDMDALRKEPRFVKFMQVAKGKKVSNLETLRKAPKYNLAEKSTLPAFTYQASSFEKLAELKAQYNLDSIAGNGNDVSRMINLTRWVHNLIRHDGNKDNPDTKNAASLIKVCRQDGKTLNCRGLGIVLNEVFLAEGFKSRFVTCLPKDPNDNDCHVITTVYSERLHKWLWMDPTFMAYVMNEKGDLLSIEEVRERLIAGKPLILNPDANWNNRSTQTKADYLENYMAKNLYKLECPLTSEYDFETMEKGKVRPYLTLVPGGSVHEPYTSARKDGMNTLRLHETANPKVFWQVP